MNYFKIGGRQYRAEIRPARGIGETPMTCASLETFDAYFSEWLVVVKFARFTRPAARRALKREIERLATGQDGKRANWTIVRRVPVVRIRFDATRATASLRNVVEAVNRLGCSAEQAGAAMGELARAYRSPEVSR